MIKNLAWIAWAVLPVLALALHYGPGQEWLARDEAAKIAARAGAAQQVAESAQERAHDAHLATFEARKQAFLAGQDPDQPVDPVAGRKLKELRAAEEVAYDAAAKAWAQTADLYLTAAETLDGGRCADALHWAAARARVRSGEVFNGVRALQQLLVIQQEAGLGDSPMAGTVREELAAAQYIGARLLREEGRPGTVWREVSGAARRNYRYLAERRLARAGDETARLMQRNLEQVLNLEQSDRSQLDGMPLPRQSPRGRRPGDCEAGSCRGKKPGRGPQKKGRPAQGAGGRMPYGPGW